MSNQSKNGIYQGRSFIAIIKKAADKLDNIASMIKFDADGNKHVCASKDCCMEVAFTLRKDLSDARANTMSADIVTLLLGDDYEWQDSLGEYCMANAVLIEFDLKRKNINIMSSIVGLPPLFIYRSSDLTIVTSDIYLLTMVPGLSLIFDYKSIIDLFSTGHPIKCRTLYRDVIMIPGGHTANVQANGEVILQQKWNIPKVDRLTDWNTFTDMQIEAFKHALRSIDISHSFLSMTAGLDTRTILAGLVQDERRLPAYTMSGKSLSLDARAARKLCQAYGIPHDVIELGEEFHKHLPEYILEASRLSGGLSSLDQAHEVYFYKKIAGRLTARLSGNLGNQIGRRGTEKISLRNADKSILNDELLGNYENSTTHWYKEARSEEGLMSYEFLIQNEIPFSSVANYSVGNHFAIQQSVYANRKLIEITQQMPRKKSNEESVSLFNMRLRDLNHRFLGETSLYSFQVKFIKAVDGYVATYPINWGWRANGGVSLEGLFWGGLSFMDALSYSKAPRSNLIQRGLQLLNVAGLHEYIQFKSCLDSLKDFIYDTLLSNSMRKTGLFNNKILTKILDEHYLLRKSHYITLSVALDLALAQQVFNAELSD